MSSVFVGLFVHVCLNHPSLPTNFTVLSNPIKQGISLHCILIMIILVLCIELHKDVL